MGSSKVEVKLNRAHLLEEAEERCQRGWMGLKILAQHSQHPQEPNAAAGCTLLEADEA